MRIAIFGTVGVGKSLISEEISKRLGYDYDIFPEPVEDNPYFADYYKDLKATVFKMQIYMLTARSIQLKQAENLENIIFDRTILEDPLFVKVNHELGHINDIDYKTYNDFYNNVILETLKLPHQRVKFDIVIYLKVSTNKAVERIKARGRVEELKTNYEYWESLNKFYNEFYNENKNNFPFFVIDAETDDLNARMEIIMAKLKELENNMKG